MSPTSVVLRASARQDVDLVFYMEGRGHVDVWRILHGRKDIPAWMRI